MKKAIRSPFFYVGDKYKLMPQLQQLMPKKIGRYIEPFVGGGSSLINTEAEEYIANDIDTNIIKLHEFLSSYADDPKKLFNELYERIDKYKLSCSYRNIKVPDELKKQYVKTYYSRYNKESYTKMRNDFNKNQEDMLQLYLLLIYGFNHMIRYNSQGKFNLPVGNVDFNKNVHSALVSYLNFFKDNKVKFYNKDYKSFLKKCEFDENTYIFLDPPYLISSSEYNKLWDEKNEKELCRLLDDLDKKGVKFGITNLVNHKGRTNEIFLKWSEKYKVYDIKSNYISFNDNTIKADSREVFVTNYAND